jgi:drug/metabolite transporter (DMT)-like permease
MMTATGQLTAATVMLAPVALLVDHSWALAQPSRAAWAAIAGLAILSTALAYLIFFRVLASSGATNLLLVTFLIPVSAVLLGFLFLGEQLEPRHFAGMGLIALALEISGASPLESLLIVSIVAQIKQLNGETRVRVNQDVF